MPWAVAVSNQPSVQVVGLKSEGMESTLNQIEAHIRTSGLNPPPAEAPCQERARGGARFSPRPAKKPFAEQDDDASQLNAREVPEHERRSTAIFRAIMQSKPLNPFIIPSPTGAWTPRAQEVGSSRRPVERGCP